MIPYGKQKIDEEDIQAVDEVLKSDFLTTGPAVDEFESNVAKTVKAKYAVAVSNGTAALHIAAMAAGLKQGDELITSPMTFAASANCGLFCGATPVFVDVDDQGLIDAEKIEANITKDTKVIIPVDYTGLSCNMKQIGDIAKKHKLIVIEDSCHAIGGKYDGTPIGNCKYADMSIFSFHPVKHITTGEGGMITTNSQELYEKLKMLRNHGMTKDPKVLINNKEGGWFYEIHDISYNYRITDFQCALGLSQLKKLESFVKRRRQIAIRYDNAFVNDPNIKPLLEKTDQHNPYHLYVIRVKDGKTRKRLYDYLKTEGIYCQVHYIPVYWHPAYQKLGYKKGLCPNAEKFYQRILSIPMYPGLTDQEQQKVISEIKNFFKS